MTTSGSWDFSLTAAQLIGRVAKNLGILSAGGTIKTVDQTDLLQTLNVVAKEFQGTSDLSPGMKVHTRQRIALFLAVGQQQYLVGPAATDARASTQYGRTTISAAEAVGQTVLSITSNTDITNYPGATITMTSGDFVGIELDDGTLQWTTISGTPSSTMTVSDSITAAAAAGNYVYWFTSRSQRFTNIEAAVMRYSTLSDSGIDIYHDHRSYDLGVASKYASGTPTAILVEPLLTNTRVTLNSQPTDVTSQIILTALYPAEDYDAVTNDIAFPQEWLGYLEWELTLRSAAMYGRAWTQDMQLNYTNAMTRARNLNPETSDLYFRCS